jgi:hypothetical protein
MGSFRDTGDVETDETKERKQEFGKERLRITVQSVVVASNKEEQTVMFRVQYVHQQLGHCFNVARERERERGV